MSESDRLTRRRILDAADQLLRRLGPSRLALRRVAEQAEVSVGLINYHFGGKQGLLEALVDTFVSDLLASEATWLERVEASEDVAGTLEDAFRHGFRLSRQHRIVMRVILGLVGQLGALPVEWRSRTQDRFLARWSEALHRRTGLPVRVLRLRLHTLLALTTRYIAASETELGMILGDDALELEAARDCVEEHLASLARGIIASPEGGSEIANDAEADASLRES